MMHVLINIEALLVVTIYGFIAFFVYDAYTLISSSTLIVERLFDIPLIIILYVEFRTFSATSS